MKRESTAECGRLGVLLVALLSGSVSAQPPSLEIVPRNAGPVGIADLNVLLDQDLQFQIFDFESQEKFCLVLGHSHEIEGQQPRHGPQSEVFCQAAGPQRLILVMRSVGDKMRLQISLHDRNTGTGGTRTAAELPIGSEATRAAIFRSEQTIRSGHETTLVRWRFGPNPPDPQTHHDVRILVRLEANDYGIGSYSRPSDFSQ